MDNELNARLAQLPPPEAILQREGSGGRMLDYLPGWYVIDTLNGVFGADRWDMSVDRLDVDGKTYTALVTLSVYTDENAATATKRQDVGIGIAANDSPLSRETAVKGAVTDAMKRAARTFGNAFGNELYRPKQMRESGRSAPKPPSNVVQMPRRGQPCYGGTAGCKGDVPKDRPICGPCYKVIDGVAPDLAKEIRLRNDYNWLKAMASGDKDVVAAYRAQNAPSDHLDWR